jgi:hypothetical protein
MRIVAGLPANERADHDFLAARRLVGAEELRHPRIVVDAIGEDDLSVAERPGRRGAGFEKVRIAVGLGENAGDSDIGAADLARHVAVEIFRRDHLHRTGECGRA